MTASGLNLTCHKACTVQVSVFVKGANFLEFETHHSSSFKKLDVCIIQASVSRPQDLLQASPVTATTPWPLQLLSPSWNVFLDCDNASCLNGDMNV